MKRIRFGLLAILTLAQATQFSLLHAQHRIGWKVHQTTLQYPKLIKQLNRAVKSEKMLLVSRASASTGAKRRKISIPGNMVVGVYRNDFALRMLDASVEAGIEAPIRFYITERPDGGGTLSYKTPSHVFAPYLADAKPDLAKLASELDQIFAAIALRATMAN